MQIKLSERMRSLSLMILCGIGIAGAHNAVKLTAGDKIETIIILQEHPKVIVEEDILTLTTDSNIIEFDWSNGARFEFVDYEYSGISNPEVNGAVFSISPETLEGRCLTPGGLISVSDMNGKTIISTKAGEDGNVAIVISELPAGVYIFNSIDKKFKFYKK